MKWFRRPSVAPLSRSKLAEKSLPKSSGKSAAPAGTHFRGNGASFWPLPRPKVDRIAVHNPGYSESIAPAIYHAHTERQQRSGHCQTATLLGLLVALSAPPGGGLGVEVGA